MDQDTTRLHRTTSKLAPRARGLLLAAACTSLLATAGCGDDGASSGPGGGQGSGGSGSTTSSSSGGGGDTTTTTTTSSPTALCTLEEIGTTAAIDPSCGVFVDASKPIGGDGSQASPFSRLQDAADRITFLGTGTIYVCGDDTHELTTSFAMPGGSAIVGGLSCSDWRAVATDALPLVLAPANLPAIVADGAGLRSLERIRVSGRAEGVDALGRGHSAIGVMLLGAELHAKDSVLIGGEGAAGLDGAATPPRPDDAPPGASGSSGCSGTGPHPGGAGGENLCLMPDEVTWVATNGGKGGDGLAAANGESGLAGVGPNGTTVAGGAGQRSATLLLPESACGNGNNANFAESGADALASSTAVLDASGYAAEVSDDGVRGMPGRGGGGGGGARWCSVPQTGQFALAGPGGGGGGAGGCGGAGGKSGKPGGASIAVLALSKNGVGSTVSLESVRLEGAQGGAGGVGRSGQFPQFAAPTTSIPNTSGFPGSGNSYARACYGGRGEHGGGGGDGAGGYGGIAALIATDSSSTVTRVGTVDDVAPVAGLGGYSEGNPGTNGVACARFDIPSWGCLPD